MVGKLGPSWTLLLKTIVAPLFNTLLFDDWFNRGIHTLKDLFFGKIFPSSAQLQDKYDTPNTQFFKFLQARAFVKKNNPLHPNLTSESLMEFILSYKPQNIGIVVKIYLKVTEYL